MPRAAIGTGVVDPVLPPAGSRASSWSSWPRVRDRADRRGLPSCRSRRPSEQLLEHAARRRAGRRLQPLQAADDQAPHPAPDGPERSADLDAYLELLREHPEEARSLYQDLLIHVTRFFREPESFEALTREVLPALLARGSGGAPLRIWVPGCATGEEAYSLAIALFERRARRRPSCRPDLRHRRERERPIEVRPAGHLPGRIAEAVPPSGCGVSSSKVDGGYRISKPIRDLCVFARQDLTRDPPFSKLDLIVCRNVLIYLDVGAAAQADADLPLRAEARRLPDARPRGDDRRATRTCSRSWTRSTGSTASGRGRRRSRRCPRYELPRRPALPAGRERAARRRAARAERGEPRAARALRPAGRGRQRGPRDRPVPRPDGPVPRARARATRA